MIRKIIHIDRNKCNGCGVCAGACHEGAIGMRDGKAVLLRDDHCDGLGDCLPACPTGAITFIEREADAYDQAAVERTRQAKAARTASAHGGCPGHRARTLEAPACTPCAGPVGGVASRLRQWPVQIKLAPVNAPFFAGADLLIAADCTAYAYARMHEDFMQGRVTLIGCPKLDATDYSEKLGVIFRENSITSVTVARMQVPCCGGLAQAVHKALTDSGKTIPCHIVTISIDGHILPG